MKKFLIKVSLYIAILLVIISILSSFFLLRSPKGFLFVSNSISCNLKAGFIEQHPEKLNQAGIVVLGSSMSLNNIDAKLLQDSFQLNTINLSSWGLKIVNFEQSPVLDQHKIFLCNLGSPDFSTYHLQAYDKFSFNNSKLRQVYDLSVNFSTYKDQLQKAKDVLLMRHNRDFKSCNFDDYGSVLLSDSGFNFDSSRWNGDDYLSFGVDSAKLKDYVHHLKDLVASHQGIEHFILTYSPGRRVFYNQNRSEMIAYLGRMIRENCPTVHFINLYDRNYPDVEYADASHFNGKGASRFTREVIDSIISRGIIKKPAF